MDRLFLDANVLFSAAYKTDARLREFWKLKDVVLCSSRYALEEARINLTNEDQGVRLHNLLGGLRFFDAEHGTLPRGISLPEKDVPIILAAMEARATHLLTGDIRHFGAYLGKKIEGIAIVLPGEYIRMRT
jgi:predicted nucleic acid-binding protein